MAPTLQREVMLDMYFPIEEYEDRWSRLYNEMDSRGYTGALVWGRSAGTYERYQDVLYLTNYYSSQSGHEYDSPAWMGVGFTAVLMVDRKPPRMVVDEPDYPTHLLPVSVDRVVWEHDLIRGTAKLLRQELEADARIALVGTDFLPMKYWEVLRSELPGIDFVEADDLVRQVRRTKSTRELDCYREVGEKVTAAMTRLCETAVRGGTQAEAAAAGAAELMRRGGVPHMIPVSSGPTMFWHCGDPLLGFSPDVVMEPGDVVRAWIYGPVWQGYWSDPGRSLVVGGNPTPRQIELIRSANDIVTKTMDAIRPGVRVGEVVALGDKLRRLTGTEDDQPGRMWPIYGHGVGMYWEEPWYMHGDTGNQTVFRAGDVVSTEVFIYHKNIGAAGVEQNFIIGSDRNELLTTTEMEWW